MIVRWDSPARLLSAAGADDTGLSPLSVLSASEHRRLSTVTHKKTRDQMAAARILLRRTLAEQNEGTTPGSWIVERDDNGAPIVRHPDVHVSPEVSMAHTNGLVAIAIDRERCGVDVEHCARPVSSRRLAKRYYPPREFEYLSALPDDELHREFILRWTVREAWTKAERSTFIDALNRTETVRDASGRLDLLVAESSRVARGYLFSDVVDGYVITALSRDDECEVLKRLGNVKSHL